MTQKVRKAVIPVAGYGTRFLPYTKSIPKEMLPIIDRPIIHHVAEEAAAAGIEEIILVTGYSKRAIEDYFDYNLELDTLLEKKGKHTLQAASREPSDLAQFIYVRQKEQRGNGHAILQAKSLIGPDEPFVVMWGDEMYMGSPNRLQQMISIYEQHEQPVFLTMQYDKDEDYEKYGYVELGAERDQNLWEVKSLVEKPGRVNAPSKHAVLGCYVLTGKIFDYLTNQQPGHGGEIVLADAVSRYAQDVQILAKEAQDLKYFDCGSKLGYMQAVVEYALLRDDIGDEFKAYIRNLANNM